jgi:hypothetical protein
MNNNITEDWKLYEAGKRYNNSLKPNYYSTVDTNIAFFNGDQWRNVVSNGMPTPVFNIIKRVITFFVASLTSNKVKINMEPLAYADDDNNPETEASRIATAEVDNLFEKFKMENRLRDAYFDAAVMGDVGGHFYFDVNKKPYGGAFGEVQGEICFELVDGTQIFFGNANNPNVDIQPYIIVQGRDMVQNLREEAKRYKQQENNIVSDKDYNYTAGDMGKLEVEINDIKGDEYGKATYIIIYRKDRKTGTIKASKCTETAYMYKDVDTGLSHYPVAWFTWEKQKNQYHGRAVSTGIIPNQIFINKIFAMVMYHLMTAAFPKAVYDADKLESWNNEIGVAIGLHDLSPGDSIRNLAAYLEPGNMSNQIVEVIRLAIDYTKETLGINDAMMGNINPEQASGRSIVATVQQSSIPLENPKANAYEWIEDIGKILLDMMGTYYGLRPIVINDKDGKRIEQFDFSVFKNMYLNVKVDVGASSYWSEIASVQTLDNLLDKGLIDIIDYLESVPEGYIMQKQELIERLKARQEMQMQNQGFDMISQFIDTLPPELQAQIQAVTQPNNTVDEAPAIM